MGLIISKSYQKTACAEQTMLSSQEESNKYCFWKRTEHGVVLYCTSALSRGNFLHGKDLTSVQLICARERQHSLRIQGLGFNAS